MAHDVPTLGNVTPDGSLSVHPDPWTARHYRRAVMRGAGVYRWGLWAMLAPGRPAAKPDAQAGAALGGEPVNGAEQLAGFAAWAAPVEKMSLGLPRTYIAAPQPAYLTEKLTTAAQYGYHWGNILLSLAKHLPGGPQAVVKQLMHGFEPLGAQLRASLYSFVLQLPKGREHRNERRQFWRTVRVLLRVLRRMAPRKPKRRPPVRRAPRPLYSRAIPPAAPLAPPALA